MKQSSPYQRALAVHIAAANPSRELSRPSRDQHRWLRGVLVAAIPLIGLAALVSEFIRWRFF